MIRWPALLLLAAYPGLVEAQEFAKLHEGVRGSLVYITATADTVDGDTRSTHSTGAVLTADGHVLTVFHILEDLGAGAQLKNDTIKLTGSVSGKHGIQEPLDVVQKNRERDLLLLKFPSRIGGFSHLCIDSTTRLAVTQPLFTSGFPKDIPYRTGSGEVISRDGENDTIVMNIPIDPGQSGSPIYLQDGRLVGIALGKVKGSDQSYSMMGVEYALALKPGLPTNCAGSDVPVTVSATGKMERIELNIRDLVGETLAFDNKEVVIRGTVVLNGQSLNLRAGKILAESASILAFPPERPPLDGASGEDGKDGDNGGAGSGNAGGGGQLGQAGHAGSDGQSSQKISLKAESFEGQLVIDASGQRGGRGGDGGDGGDGGRGGAGRSAVSGLFDCRQGPGNGGDGGNAGRGGDGGKGGDGGDAADVTLSFGSVQAKSKLSVVARGGSGGAGGQEGIAGRPGEGGPRGEVSGLCTGGGRGTGSPGQAASVGTRGRDGEDGADALVTLQIGTNVEVLLRSLNREF